MMPDNPVAVHEHELCGQHDQQLRRLEERSPRIYEDIQKAVILAAEAKADVARVIERIPEGLKETLAQIVVKLDLVQRVVFGAVGLVLLTVLLSLLYLVVRNHGI